MIVDSLPQGWAIAKTSETIETNGIIADGDWIESKDQDPNGDVRLIQLADIGDGDFRDKSERFMTSENAEKMNCTFLETGDLLVARMPDPLGRACIFPGVGQKAVTVVDICLIRPNTGSALQNKLLMYWINSPQVRNFIALQATGTTRKRITRKKLEALELPIPPLAEQQQIAAKLDELLAQVDTLKTRLDTIPKILKRFRQSVIAAAVSGNLTEDWRNEHAVLKWPRIRIEDITSKVGSGATPKGGESAYKTEGIPLIRSMNVVFFGFKRKGIAFIDSAQAHDLRNVEVQFRDVLLNITGASIGRVTIAPQDMEGARVNQHVCIIRPKPELLPEFLCWFFAAPAMQRIIGAENYGVTRQALTKQQILSFEIALPSFEEQIEIVRRVEQIFTYADQIEQRVKDAQARVNHLTQSILAKAFRGELTADWREQNPDLISGENSAEALLARIKEERHSQGHNKVTKRRTIKKSGESMKPKGILPIIEALKTASQPLSSQDLLVQSGYPGDASTEQLEAFFLDIRAQLNAKAITRNRQGDQEFFSIAE